MRKLENVFGILIAIAVASSPVRADQGSPVQGQPQPWAIGVTPEQKAAALQYLDRGNTQFLERKFAAALEEYRRAIASWNHPAIRFNVVRCLILLERPVEAAANLELALQYGAAPFDEAIYSEALAYQKLIAKQIGNLEIACTQSGVELTLDGQPLLACPGKERRRVLPGQHQIVGTKPGYLPRTIKLVVFGGTFEQAVVALDPLEKGAKIVHRWPTWIPWSVVGGGFAVAGIGGLIQWKAGRGEAGKNRTPSRSTCLGGRSRLQRPADAPCRTRSETTGNRPDATSARSPRSSARAVRRGRRPAQPRRHQRLRSLGEAVRQERLDRLPA